VIIEVMTLYLILIYLNDMDGYSIAVVLRVGIYLLLGGANG